MKTVTGVFRVRSDAERALAQLNSLQPPQKKLHAALLVPGNVEGELKSVPVTAGEQPGMGKAIGAVIGASAGLSGGALVLAAVVPGVGPITAVGLLGASILAAAGGTIGAVAGSKLENAMTDGLPEDELFVYEDALRKGRTVVVAQAENEAGASAVRELLKAEGAEEVDAARERWWIGLRSAEREHYTASGKDFGQDEKFYRLGFEAALHARYRCQEYDQILSEMSAQIEELERKNPGANVGEPFTKGYERGREYYQGLCNQSKAA